MTSVPAKSELSDQSMLSSKMLGSRLTLSDTEDDAEEVIISSEEDMLSKGGNGNGGGDDDGSGDGSGDGDGESIIGTMEILLLLVTCAVDSMFNSPVPFIELLGLTNNGEMYIHTSKSG